ncbi:MAG: hypothetical protein ACXWQ5_00090 [Ktedonobacterales bacterium]
MRADKKLLYLQKLEAEEREQAFYQQMAEEEAQEAQRRSRPTKVVPILTFNPDGRLIKCLQPFVVYAEPMNGGVLVTTGISQAAGLGADINAAIVKLLAGLEHRYLYLRLHTGNMVPGMEDELRTLTRFVALK